MEVVLKIGVLLFSFVAMEGVAWFTHKYIMHGPLWMLHKDHHVPHKGHLERNDLFALFFSSPAVVLMVLGGKDFNLLFFAGCGITLYGLCYFIFHDIIVHRRIKLKFKPGSRYMKRIIRAHKIHHKSLGKDDAEAFGFLFALPRYDAREYKRNA